MTLAFSFDVKTIFVMLKTIFVIGKAPTWKF